MATFHPAITNFVARFNAENSALSSAEQGLLKHYSADEAIPCGRYSEDQIKLLKRTVKALSPPPLGSTACRTAQLAQPILKDSTRLAATRPMVKQLSRAPALDTPQVAHREDGTVQATLNRRADNPTATETSTTFQVQFGEVAKTLGYALRHNSEAAGVTATNLAKLSGQTRLLLQQVYRFYEGRWRGEDETATFKLSVLQDITSYHIRFNSDESSITLEFHDSHNRSFSHTLDGQIEGDANTGAFEVKEYLIESKHIVETALKEDKAFARNSGRTFFLKFVEAGGTFPKEEKKKEISADERNALYQEFMARAQQEARARQEQEVLRRQEAERQATAAAK